MGLLLKMLLVVVVVAVLLDLMTEAKTGSSRSSRRRKSGRGERTGRRGRNRPEKMLLHNVQFQNKKLLQFLRRNNISVTWKDKSNFPLMKTCKRLLHKKLRCKSTTDHSKFQRDVLRRMTSFHSLMEQAKNCTQRENPVDKMVHAVEAVVSAIGYYLTDKTKRPTSPWKYECKIPADVCSSKMDTIRQQVLIISTKLDKELKCFERILPTTPTQSDSDKQKREEAKERKRKNDTKKQKRAKKEVKAVFSSMLEKYKLTQWDVECKQDKITLVVQADMTSPSPTNSNATDPIRQLCVVDKDLVRL